MRERGRFARRAAALALAGAVLLGRRGLASQLPENVAAQIRTAITLAQTDVSANSAAIKVLLQQSMAQLGEDPAAKTLQSVITLLDTGAADSASVTALLDTVLSSQDAPVSEEAQEAGNQEEDHSAASQAQSQEAGDQTQERHTAEQAESDGAGNQEESGDDGNRAESNDAAEQSQEETSAEETARTIAAASGLPVYQVSSFIRTVFGDTCLMDVPGGWGNNASGRSVTSYSPVNGSGAISPAAGTLTVSYFPMDGQDETAAFDNYEKQIAAMSIVSDMTDVSVQTDYLSGRKLDFIMTVGANSFACETVCFVYDGTMYTVELMQGSQSSYDYFPVYDEVVDSAQVGDAMEIAAAAAQQSETEVPQSETQMPQNETAVQSETSEPETETAVPQSETQVPQTETSVPQSETQAPQSETSAPQSETELQTETSVPQSETQAPQSETSASQSETELQTETSAPQSETQAPQSETGPEAGTDLPSDMGTFMYALNGHVYSFPTAMAQIRQTDLPLDRNLPLPYDFRSDADMEEGTWTEIVNTQYYYFENTPYKEMAGVTNMSGYAVPLSQGYLTALIDTQGTDLDVVLPGGVHVGSAESAILNGFPEFAGAVMDGTAYFRGNELLYACNVRDDGCNGYVLIRNDAPFYSAVSIICENGVIKEISFECLGSVRASGVFL